MTYRYAFSFFGGCNLGQRRRNPDNWSATLWFCGRRGMDNGSSDGDCCSSAHHNRTDRQRLCFCPGIPRATANSFWRSCFAGGDGSLNNRRSWITWMERAGRTYNVVARDVLSNGLLRYLVVAKS